MPHNPPPLTDFQQAILSIVRLVPPGHVVSYGQVAAYIGVPRAARQVGGALRYIDAAADFPWWRVINNAGRITIKGHAPDTPYLQKELLESEGIEVSDDLELDIERYRFLPDPVELEAVQLSNNYISQKLSRP